MSIQATWEKRATVRSRPRIELDLSQEGFFFPLARQPLSAHPQIQALGEEALEYVLIQSLYKYSNDISTIETRIVNQAILNATTDSLPVLFSTEQKTDLFTIMVDEAYHAYVAFDCMAQLREHKKIEPLELPKKIEIEYALDWAYQRLPQELHTTFQFIAVCLAENTLTKEIVDIMDVEGTHPFFRKMIKDHLSDEGRHCGVFINLLKYLWEHSSKPCKEQIGSVLPGYLEHYLGTSVELSFNKQILNSLGLPEQSILAIMNDSYHGFKLNKQHPMLKNIITQLEYAQVIDESLKAHFLLKNWL